MPHDLSYVLPIRRARGGDLDDLPGYLRWLARRADVLVVDGSPPAAYAANGRSLAPIAGLRHMPPDPDLRFANGKVNGVWTGMRHARAPHVVIADDDVRYDDAALAAMGRLLERFDLVRPQNYYRPLPWQARWDGARHLVNRALGGDFPGTFGVRRRRFGEIGGYDGDVLFENLELMRAMVAGGGSLCAADGLFVARRPPPVRHFLAQRVRQAYEDLAMPRRFGVELALLPVGLALVRRFRGRALAAMAGAAVGLAEAGRRRDGARRVFPMSVALWAPAWIAERAVCAWAALALRAWRGGMPYAGATITRPATAPRALAGRPAGGRFGWWETGTVEKNERTS